MDQKFYPSEVVSRLEILGERIRIARSRRQWSMEALAERIGIGRRTIARMEQGDPGIALGVFLTAIWTLDLWETVADAADTRADKTGEFLEKQRLPKRVRMQRDKDLDF